MVVLSSWIVIGMLILAMVTLYELIRSWGPGPSIETFDDLADADDDTQYTDEDLGQRIEEWRVMRIVHEYWDRLVE